jgi:hypothetical protein
MFACGLVVLVQASLQNGCCVAASGRAAMTKG